jgi:hypothetical protein
VSYVTQDAPPDSRKKVPPVGWVPLVKSSYLDSVQPQRNGHSKEPGPPRVSPLGQTNREFLLLAAVHRLKLG